MTAAVTQRLVTSKDRRGDELDGKKTLKLMVESEESTQTKEYMKEHEDQSRGCHLQLLLVQFRVPVTSKLNQTPQMRTSRPEHLLSHATQDAQHVENSLNTNAVTGPSARGADTAFGGELSQARTDAEPRRPENLRMSVSPLSASTIALWEMTRRLQHTTRSL